MSPPSNNCKASVVSHPAEREGGVEGGGGAAADDVGADAQPVGLQGAVADPLLQVAAELVRRGRQPEEVAVPQPHLRHEEVVPGGEVEARREGDLELDLRAGTRPLAAGGLVG